MMGLVPNFEFMRINLKSSTFLWWWNYHIQKLVFGLLKIGFPAYYTKMGEPN